MSVRIEPASASDLPALLAVMATAFDTRYGEAWSGPQLLGSLGMPETWVRIARTDPDNVPIGFVLARRILSEAELLLVAVAPARRGEGIGRRLVDDAAAAARARGAARIFLEVRAGNDPALALYRATAFTTVGRRASYYAGDNGARFDAITMRRELAGD